MSEIKWKMVNLTFDIQFRQIFIVIFWSILNDTECLSIKDRPKIFVPSWLTSFAIQNNCQNRQTVQSLAVNQNFILYEKLKLFCDFFENLSHYRFSNLELWINIYWLWLLSIGPKLWQARLFEKKFKGQ